MSRCFLSKNHHLLTRAFTSYVRPILEYASPVWSPHFTKDIAALERVQRRFTKSFHNLRSLPCSTRIERLDLQPLHIRRLNIDLTTCYHLIHELTHLDYTIFFTLRPHSVTRGHPFTFTKPLVWLNTNKFSFFSRTIDPWNNLPLISVTSGSLPVFKFKLKYPPCCYITTTSHSMFLLSFQFSHILGLFL